MERKNSKNKKQNSNKSKNEENFDWKRASKTSLVWLLIIFFAVYVSGTLTESNKEKLRLSSQTIKTI